MLPLPPEVPPSARQLASSRLMRACVTVHSASDMQLIGSGRPFAGVDPGVARSATNDMTKVRYVMTGSSSWIVVGRPRSERHASAKLCAGGPQRRRRCHDDAASDAPSTGLGNASDRCT